jgi:hypothetical protein
VRMSLPDGGEFLAKLMRVLGESPRGIDRVHGFIVADFVR